MNFNFYICFVFCILVIHYIDGARVDKQKGSANKPNRRPTQVEAVEPEKSENGPQYIKQFSDSLKYLSTFLNTIQKELDKTITGIKPGRPNLILSAVLSNPTLLTMALKRLREPIADMIKIVDQIQKLVATSDSSTGLEDNSQLSKLLQQLQSQFQTVFGSLFPNSGLSFRLPTNIGDALDSLNNFVSQLALVMTVISNSVRNVTLNLRPLTGNTTDLAAKRTELAVRADQICSQINSFLISDSSELSNRQASLLGTLLSTIGAVLQFICNFIKSIIPTFTCTIFVNTGPIDRVFSLFENFSIPLETKNVDDFQQISFGIVDKNNRLIITNILTKELDNSTVPSINNKQQLFSKMSVISLNSLMSSLVNDLKDIEDIKIVNTLQCQIESFRCTLRNRDNYSQVQPCLKTLSSCLSTDSLNK